jgi:predicted KAP-like P-loop ATPase
MDDRTHQLTYWLDQPIHSKREDRFNCAPFAQRVADTTATRSDRSSIVIGLYGPWGRGKSSTLNLVEEALNGHSNVAVVRFNPWLYSSEERQLRGFFDTLAAALGRSLPTKAEDISNLLRDYGALLLAPLSVAGVRLPNPPGALPRIGDSLASAGLDELKQQIEEVLERAGKRVVVLIDDIDRLERTEMQAIFKLVKLSASFTSTSYVLSFDDEMVASSIGERYAQAGYEAGREYLAKSIQVPLHLPPPDAARLRQMVFDGVAAALRQSRIELGKNEVAEFARHFIEGLEPRLGTPRHAKLYVNAVTFALPLLEEQAHPVDLLLMEGIRVFYPKLYLAIRDNADLFLGGGRDSDQNTEGAQRRRIADLVRQSTPDIAPEQCASLRHGLLESLFPRLGKMRYAHDHEADWAREQRVCSEQYFQRYFTYSVPPGDIGDLDQSDAGEALAHTESEQDLEAKAGELITVPLNADAIAGAAFALGSPTGITMRLFTQYALQNQELVTGKDA